ncbi:MAG: hypothetical protein HY707_06105 [Ignavibacteriae bacterium]|nr:hypothetical protein [Ignavibacteriota bacterium]
MKPQEYRTLIELHLVRLFGGENVKPEWNVAKGSRDTYTRALYCPKIDMAIGPFNMDGEVESNLERIGQTMHQHRALVAALVDASETAVGGTEKFLEAKNKNPRWFMAIELEYSGTTKHRLGDIANVSILGGIGGYSIDRKESKVVHKVEEIS